ncbi:MAG: N-acetylmuramic acid 6-phosphate etherase [Betaproteobacteria bacterium]|nr:N-acetylmuramic acid 6-phosphate etherase [Betaproteobacteria bacterium]
MSTTETPNAEHAALDQYDARQLVDALVSDQAKAAQAVARAAADIARAVDAAVPRIEAGGRLIYAGAGTSGRLGLLDSVELYPTFSWPPERAIALLAGGEKALYRAVEGAEDSAEQGGADIRASNASANDVVIVLAASGTTPYARGAIAAARAAGALTLGLSNNRESPVAQEAEIGIVIDTGAEVISGSTRMKAGTAQKITLNAFSSALMVRLNKVYGNLMVDLKATNAKLVKRAERLTMLATGCEAATARAALDQCGNHVKTAIVMIQCKLDAAAARARLDAVKGSVRNALDT